LGQIGGFQTNFPMKASVMILDTLKSWVHKLIFYQALINAVGNSNALNLLNAVLGLKIFAAWGS